MSNYVENLNDLIVAKNEIKSIIQDGGLEPGEVFAQYPGYIASIIEGGGTSSYLLVTKEELYACGYITAYDVSNMSYATQSYVADYVSTHSGGGSGDLSDYVTYTYLYAYVGDALSDIDVDVDLDDYTTFEDISNMGYITINDVPSVDLSSYVSYSYLESKQYLTEVPNDYPTYTAISEMGYITAADVPEVNLSYVLSTYNLRYINETPFYDGKKLYLLNSGLDVSDTGAIYPESYSYSQIVGYLNNDSSHPWIGAVTMKNYVEGRIAELESSSVTPSYLAANYITYGYASANYVSYSYAYNTFVSYAYLGDLEQISEYILGSGSSSAPENVYATKVELASYATKLELGAYVSKISLESMSYITMDDVSACGYITANDISIPVINENIIPKETGTYTLGDSSHLYAASYISDIWMASDTRFSYRGINQVNLYMNGNWRYVFHSNNFSPVLSNQSLGTSTSKWANTYTSNLYADTIHNFIWTGTSAEYAALDNYTTYQIYLIQEA